MRNLVLSAGLGVIAALGLAPACSSSSPSGTPGNDGGADASPAVDAGAPLTYQVSAAPATGTITGLARDFDTLAPLANVRVELRGGAITTTAADGSFTLTGPIGRASLAVSLAGYVPSTANVAVGSAPISLRVNLRAIAPPQDVGASGAVVAAGGAQLSIPAGAYTTTTSFSATWLDGRALVAGLRSRRFSDAGSAPRRAFGLLHVEVATEPAAPVTVTLPVPAGVDPAHVVLVERLADGTFGAPTTPSSTAPSSATFAVAHFSDEVAATDSGAATIDVAQADPGTTFTTPDGAQQDLADGAVVASDTGTVGLAPGGTVELENEPPTSGCSQPMCAGVSTWRWYMNLGSAVGHLAVRAAETFLADRITQGDVGKLERLFGVVRIAEPFNSAGAAADVELTTFDGVVHPHGTVYTAEGVMCPPSDGSRVIQSVETEEGSVSVDQSSGSTVVAAGQIAKACEGCASPTAPPLCCDKDNCKSGCCAPGASPDPTFAKCMPGTDAHACGTGASKCQDCGSGTCGADQTCNVPMCTTCPSKGGGTQPIGGTQCSMECGPNPPMPGMPPYQNANSAPGECTDFVFVTPGDPNTQCTWHACSCIQGVWQCVVSGTGACP